MSEKCYRCGTIYDGWSCPICSLKRDMEKAHEEASRDQERMLEEQGEAIESAMEDTRADIEVAAARQEKAIAESWRSQAEAKIHRAYDLYRADLNEEAIKLCLEAISQDPGNIGAYRVACWAYADMGQEAKARDLLKKQIQLLETKAYANDTAQALQVLRDIVRIEGNTALISSFIEVVRHSRSVYGFLDELMESTLYEEARQLYSARPRRADNHEEALLGLVYEIELDNKVSGKAHLDKLNSYVKSLAATDRRSVVEGFRDIAGSGKFSEDTIDAVRTALLDRYKEWKPDIEKELAKTAAGNARYKADTSGWPYVGWIAGIAVSILIVFPGSTLLHELLRVMGISLAGVFVWLIGIAGGILAGLVISRVIRGSIRYDAEPRLLASIRRDEEAFRQSIELVHAAPRQGVTDTRTETKTPKMDKHVRDYKGFGGTERFKGFSDLDEARQWLKDKKDGKL